MSLTWCLITNACFDVFFTQRLYLEGPSKYNNDCQSIFFATHFKQLLLSVMFNLLHVILVGTLEITIWHFIYSLMVASAILPFGSSIHTWLTAQVHNSRWTWLLWWYVFWQGTSHLIQSRRCKINAPNKFTAYMISWKFLKSQSLATLVISGPNVGRVLLMGRVGLWLSLAICLSIWNR